MKKWIIQQQWSNVLFVNWKVDPLTLQKIIPFDLDLHEKQAVVSVVPFFMSHVRFPWTPRIPFISELWELNLRTYVVHQGRPGIYFLTLDSSHRLGNCIARSFFKLPYQYASIQFRMHQQELSNAEYILQASGKNYQMNLKANVSKANIDDSFQRWVTERYCLFIRHGNKVIRGDVEHEKWKVQKAELKNYSGNFSDQYGVQLPSSPSSVYYAKKLNVRFSPFQIL